MHTCDCGERYISAKGAADCAAHNHGKKPLTSNELAEELRKVVAEIRRRPYPISDLIPLLNRAADALTPETETGLPEGLRDPLRVIERGRELLAAIPCWCPFCKQPHGVNQTPITDAALKRDVQNVNDDR